MAPAALLKFRQGDLQGRFFGGQSVRFQAGLIELLPGFIQPGFGADILLKEAVEPVEFLLKIGGLRGVLFPGRLNPA